MTLAAGSIPFAQINTKIVSRVATALNIGVQFVRPIASDTYVQTEFENLFAYVRAFAPSLIDARTGQTFSNQGGGRLALTIGRRIRIIIYTRSGVDVEGGDEVALGGQDPTQTILTPPAVPGQFIAEELTINALNNWTPTYINQLSQELPLTLGPIHWIPSEGGPTHKPINFDGMISSFLDFQVVYILSINKEEPAPNTLPTPIQNP